MSPPAALTGAVAVVVAGVVGGAVAVMGAGAPGGSHARAPAGAGAGHRAALHGPARPAPALAGRGAARQPPTNLTPRPVRRWVWPLEPVPRVGRAFRAPRSQWGPGHRGLDLVAQPGQAVGAVEGGVVTHAAVIAGRGTVSVRHPDDLVSTYEPVRPDVAVGDVVSVGEEVGVVHPSAVGSHCGATTCLHLGARRAGAYLDPWPLLAGGELVLLPLGR